MLIIFRQQQKKAIFSLFAARFSSAVLSLNLVTGWNGYKLTRELWLSNLAKRV